VLSLLLIFPISFSLIKVEGLCKVPMLATTSGVLFGLPTLLLKSVR